MPQPHLIRNRLGLAEFLRARRERLQPADFGLPTVGRRHTKGLRREEVASLAGIGLTWYTWFEQGRDIRVSTAFLDNLARALRLNSTERSYLFFLAGHQSGEREAIDSMAVAPSLRRLIEGLGPRPAYLKNMRWDVLAWNAAARFAFGDFAETAPERRNIVWLTFAESRFRDSMADWETDARRLIARFRADYAKISADDVLRRLLDDLDAISPDFRRLWRAHDVYEKGDGMRLVAVPGVGAIDFDYTICKIGEADQIKAVIYAPNPDGANAERFVAACEAATDCAGARRRQRVAG
ncbi:MAG: helix-turn-helix transcriptional regulator [Alphaproteobacteria bacterium]